MGLMVSPSKIGRDALHDFLRLNPDLRVLMDCGEWHILTTNADDHGGLVYALGIYDTHHRLSARAMRDRAEALRDYLRNATGHHAMVEVYFEERGT